MTAPGMHPLEAILRHVAAAGPDPWYPSTYAQATGTPRDDLDPYLDQLAHIFAVLPVVIHDQDQRGRDSREGCLRHAAAISLSKPAGLYKTGCDQAAENQGKAWLP